MVSLLPEVLSFASENTELILTRTVGHITLVLFAVGSAIVTGVPLGIYITQNEKLAKIVLYISAIIVTIPSIAMFGLMIPVLSVINQGIGYLPAIIAVFLYSQLPIIRNTYTAINNVDPALREAARGVGMSPLQRLRMVEIPLAIPILMTGVRTAVVMNIGVMTIAAYIGAGGLGVLISQGITQTDPVLIIIGSFAVCILAVISDYGLLWLQRKLTPAGL